MRNKFVTIKQPDLIIYISKCLIGVTIGFCIYSAYPNIGLWFLVSVVIVLSPNSKDSFKLSLYRIKANLIGAAIGLGLFFIHPTNLLMVCIGVVLVIMTCQFLNLQDAARTACVAVVIILLHEKGAYFWDVALERAGGVLGGCMVAMLITFLFHVALRKLNDKKTD